MNGDVPVRKFYIRYREGIPETETQATALYGFRTLGIETVPFEGFGDIDTISDLGPEVGIAGYIGDVQAGLQKLGAPLPVPLDYPEVLRHLLGREVWKGLLGEIEHAKEIFVKPVEQKAFTGFLWQNTPACRRKIVTQHDDTPVWYSTPVNFVAEYRSFILNGEVLDCRLYKGDWSQAPDREVVEYALRACKGVMPVAYTLDWGVTALGQTLLVEANDGYAMGTYGLPPVPYAKMLAARWAEMTKTP